MECTEFEKIIPDFIKRKMNYVTLKAFAEHVENCPRCKEELTIQFLIDEGLVRLEEGNAFDLNRELRMRMAEAKKKIRRHDRVISAGVVAQYGAMIGIAVGICYIIFG